MRKFFSLNGAIVILLAVALLLAGTTDAFADKAAKLEKGALAGLQVLYAKSDAAKALAPNAAGILVFPSMIKGGFIFGGQTGDGALIKGNDAVAYYNSSAVSYGFQAGLQKFGYALFFMSNKDLDYLKDSAGWEVGTAPNLTIVDEGMAGSLSTTTAKSGVYAFFFGQEGLMAGIGLQGAKITKLHLDTNN